jgi:hypothetical protein
VRDRKQPKSLFVVTKGSAKIGLHRRQPGHDPLLSHVVFDRRPVCPQVATHTLGHRGAHSTSRGGYEFAGGGFRGFGPRRISSRNNSIVARHSLPLRISDLPGKESLGQSPLAIKNARLCNFLLCCSCCESRPEKKKENGTRTRGEGTMRDHVVQDPDVHERQSRLETLRQCLV